MSKRLLFSSFAVVLFLFTISSCKKDKVTTDSGAKLAFSQDTVKFDTVFATVGSATQVFIVYNNNSQPINISSIRFTAGSASYYRLNVNGTPGRSFTNVEIGANDSIFVFAEVTIDPNNSLTPFIVTDAIEFTTNGNVQHVQLVAYGQNAYFYPSSSCGEQKSQCSSFFKLKDCAGGSTTIHWTNDKPHVIYGYAVLDAGYTLLIDSGTNIHFHNNSGLMVLSTAKVIVNGTLTSPVTFQGDRLGDAYKDVAGQWDRIWFSNITSFDISGCPIQYSAGPGPKGNVFNYAIIKNGYVGLESDTVASAHQPAVVLNNTIIKNFASTGLYAQGSGIQANNCVFANCGEYCAAIYYGGDYRFLHCTFADFWSTGNRQTPAVYLQNYYDVVRPLDSAYFGNCIIYGSTDNEIGLDSANVSGGSFNFKFDHCLLKFNKSTAGADHFQSIILNSDPKFTDTGNNVYELDPTSPAVDAGDIIITNMNAILNIDLKGNPRPKPGTAPDLGAYEVQ